MVLNSAIWLGNLGCNGCGRHDIRVMIIDQKMLCVERIPVREPFSVGLGCALVLRNVDSVITIWISFSKLSIAIVCS